QKRLVWSILALFVCVAPLALAQHAPAPAPAAPACPKLNVSAPDTVTSGDEIKITANVTGGDKDVTPTYNWSVSAGSIASGQGTSVITIDSKEIEAGSTVTASVDIGGYSPECSLFSSATVNVEKKADKKPTR
ncbi:MAG: hypothetical protein JOZ54_00185, partial [Acidobacteria bacterium]|nr:hypothetical protein [Acidobacteriota bacterium]